MRTVLLTSVTILILTSSLHAGTYNIVYQEQIEGAEQSFALDPILSEPDILDGIILTYREQMRIEVLRFGMDAALVLPINGITFHTDNYTASDTLVVYTAFSRDRADPQIARIVVLDTVVSLTEVTAPIAGGLGTVYYSTLAMDVNTFSDGLSDPLVVLNAEMHFEEFGYLEPDRHLYSPTSTCYSLDLSEHTPTVGYLIRGIGRFLTDDLEYVGFRNSTYSIYYDDQSTIERKHSFQIGNFEPEWLCRLEVLSNCHDQILVGDVFPETPLLEIVYQSTCAPFNCIGCYNAVGDSVESFWVTPSDSMTIIEYLFRDSMIVGRSDWPDVVFIDARTGQYIETVQLGRPLRSRQYFVSDDRLSLIGRVYDTIFVYQFDTPTGIEERPDPELPTTFSLHQNYPNPFNPETIVEFELPRRCHATLRVYNILGQEIATLLDRDLAAGNHSATWDGTTHASGVYLYRLQTEDYSQTKKMVLLK